MTEAEWLAGADPTPMVNFLRGKHPRKLRLFFCACSRSVWALFDRPLYRTAVEAGERLADGLASDDELAAIRLELCPEPFFRGDRGKLAEAAYGAVAEGWPVWAFWAAADLHLARMMKEATANGRRNLPRNPGEEIRRGQASLLRDIFGNPFRPVSADPVWLTPTVVALAQGIYDEKAFDRLPILADALQDAGCDSADVLNHCHGPGSHVRGCWVVDLLLGK